MTKPHLFKNFNVGTGRNSGFSKFVLDVLMRTYLFLSSIKIKNAGPLLATILTVYSRLNSEFAAASLRF